MIIVDDASMYDGGYYDGSLIRPNGMTQYLAAADR